MEDNQKSQSIILNFIRQIKNRFIYLFIINIKTKLTINIALFLISNFIYFIFFINLTL
jgi:hypothetical protein